MDKFMRLRIGFLALCVLGLQSAPPSPQCGVGTECVVISRPTFTVSSGVRRPVNGVYRSGKKIQFKQSPDKTLGPYAVIFDMDKSDSIPETILFDYR